MERPIVRKRFLVLALGFFIAGYYLVVNMEKIYFGMIKKVIERIESKYFRHASGTWWENLAKESHLIATYWLEPDQGKWDLVVYLENKHRLRTERLFINSYFYYPAKHRWEKRLEEVDTVYLPPRSSKRLRYLYMHTLSIEVKMGKDIIFYAPFWWAYPLSSWRFYGWCGWGVPIERDGKCVGHWSPTDWDTTLEMFKDRKPGVYWVGGGVLIQLESPSLPVVKLGDTLKFTYHYKVPSSLFDLYERDTLYLVCNIYHRAHNMSLWYDFSAESLTVESATCFSSDFLVVDTITYFTFPMARDEVKKVHIQYVVNKKDISNRSLSHSKYKSIWRLKNRFAQFEIISSYILPNKVFINKSFALKYGLPLYASTIFALEPEENISFFITTPLIVLVIGLICLLALVFLRMLKRKPP
ncbi:MAG: hypothetical protein DRN12_06555 [Thermoplasmata archaeon]|nr:MAG: hypothetical protein DRN12_06555 [Thermoplasmata archaeon]